MRVFDAPRGAGPYGMTFPPEGRPGNVRQIHGHPGEVWAPESATHIVVMRTRPNG